MAIKPKKQFSVPAGKDRVIVGSTLWVDGTEYVDLREEKVSTKKQGRGFLLPRSSLKDFAGQLENLDVFLGGRGPAKASVGQQTLFD